MSGALQLLALLLDGEVFPRFIAAILALSFLALMFSLVLFALRPVLDQVIRWRGGGTANRQARRKQ